MRKIGLLITFIAASVLFTTSCAPATNPADTSEFLVAAAKGGMTEVELSSLALTRTQNPEIRQFALQMAADHSKANDELKPLAASKSVSLPKDLGSAEKSLSDKLSKLSGAEFDKEYVEAMVADHEKDVQIFQMQAQNGSDAEVKAFAAKTLPTLQQHLQTIQSIKAKM